MTIKVADRGIDYSGARPKPADTLKAGGTFVIRYSAGAGNKQANTQWKLITPAEFKATVAAGLDIIANSEWYESRITEGAGAGKSDGAADLALWKSCGLAKGASIYVSWDAAPVGAKWAAVDAYLKAYNTALGGYYFVDCYAGTPYLKHALANKLIRHGWRPNAGSWSNDGLPYQPDTSTAAKRTALATSSLDNTPAAIYQTGNYWFAKGADENLILRASVGSHLQAKAAAAAPAKPAVVEAASHYYKPATTGAGGSTAIVSPNGNFAAFMQDDGRVAVHKYDPKTKRGVIVRYL